MVSYDEIQPELCFSNLLENDPVMFKMYLKNPIYKNQIQKWVHEDCKLYRNWYSPVIHQLFYLTGKLLTQNKSNFFGSKIEIDQDLACELFDLLLPFNPNPNDTNYYDENLYQLITNRKSCLTERKENEVFIKHIMTHYKWDYPSNSNMNEN